MIHEPYSNFDGFEGFKTISHYRSNIHQLPNAPGVYVIARTETGNPDFLSVGVGGHFKGKNPNVSLQKLKSNWVSNAKVVYIGQAGGNGSSATLRKRIDQLLKFGEGRNIGHWGGRLLWQLADHERLVLSWKTSQTRDAKELETELIQDFKNYYGVRPFANLVG